MFLLFGCLLLLLPFLGTTLTLWLLLLGTAAIYFHFRITKLQNVWEEKGIKNIKPQLLQIFQIFRTKSLIERIQALYNEFPGERYHGVYQFTLPTLILKDPDLIKQITVKEFDHFVNHRVIASVDIDPFWSKNVFASRDARWRELRSTLSPSFTSSKMRFMFTLIDESARQFVDYFKEKREEAVELEMKDTLRRYTNDVIATTAFGVKCNSLKDRTNEFYVMGKDASDFGGLRVLRFFLYALSPTLAKLFRVKVISTKIAKYFTKIIEDTVKTRQERNIVRPDMIHLLMEAQKGHHDEEDTKINEGFSSVPESNLTQKEQKQKITLEDISSQAFIFFLAGFETVSTCLTFAFYELAINPDIQSRLRDEIQTVSGEVTYETLLGLKYLDMVMSEALRKWPPAVLSDREVSKDFVIKPERPGERPLLLEKGFNCWLAIYAIHRDDRFYPDPEKFDPERFSEENKHTINPSVYLPFGAGPRSCLGSRFALLECKLIIFHVLKNFEVVTTAKSVVPVVLDKYQVNLTAQGGMWLGLRHIE